jgi:hypothetical protein
VKNRALSAARRLAVITLSTAFALLAGTGVYAVGWIARGGTHVFIPWVDSATPRLTLAELETLNLLRTRSGAQLHAQRPCECAIVFWHVQAGSGFDTWAINAMAGFNGLSHVTVDCCLEGANERWLIGSGQGSTASGYLDGPHYLPSKIGTGRISARVNIAKMLDCQKLLNDLRLLIDDARVRHKGPEHFLSLIFDRDDNLVTCSGLIGKCILRQPATRLAALLRQSVRERVTIGEIRPNDLARALALGHVSEERQPSRSFRTGPVWDALMRK